ncbi:TetR/AcrR family transcriptional regulator [Streptomyces sp. NPDC090026]|uniref:TetR/AcrR family transcriptional regulator n=1 Tax=Streptomyces sp. NPDC090026 TaxID=3365923 RepID=UPI0038191FE4
MAAPRTAREAWVEEGLRALASGGPGAVRVEVLAQALGVTKGGFYGYFRNRDALLAEMLDAWEREATDAIIERVQEAGGDPRERLGRLFALTAPARGPSDPPDVELAVRDWARRDGAVAERLRRVDQRRMEFLRSLYRPICADEDEVEVRSLTAFSLRIATPLLNVDHGGRSRAEVMELTARWLLR